MPFGKAAFMPGNLIHTNEILVHLGESYYSERYFKTFSLRYQIHSKWILQLALEDPVLALKCRCTNNSP